ncbi:PKD domain-containing protein [Flavobacterium sp.]|uniref:PKD domain-containing protein n=1 Tax=Flavobacterium sp. TaxID=239 RepID=UPI0039E35A4B
MKKIVGAFCLLMSVWAYSQSDLSPNGAFDTVFDNYGNSYTLSEIQTQSVSTLKNGSTSTTQLLCSSGMFELYFESNSGMSNVGNPVEDARRNVICQVFQDVSNFINSPLKNPGNYNKIRIWVRDINQVLPANQLPSSTSGVGGLATSFFNLSTYSAWTSGGIVDNQIWQMIHTGVDPYNGLLFPVVTTNSGTNSTGIFYHGMVSINFNNPSRVWNTDLNAYNAATGMSGKVDLYTVMLHELTHALGFATLMNQYGTSIYFTNPGGNVFSRYDKQLKNGANTAAIINNPTTSGQMYAYSLNIPQGNLWPGCTATDHLFNGSYNHTQCTGNVAMKYVSGAVNSLVYTPPCFEMGSSLSHFEDECTQGNDAYFVMSNQTPLGVSKRYLKDEERKVLCDLGYSVNGVYGVASQASQQIYYNYNTSACSGIIVAGVSDGLTSTSSFVYTGNTGAAIKINGSGVTSILSNDYSINGVANIRFEKLQDIYDANATFTVDNGSLSTNVFLTSNVPGVHLLRYVPYDVTTNQRGNITYVYVNVKNTCTAQNTCNLVKNGNFEQYATTMYPTASQLNRACGWEGASYFSTPDYFNSTDSSPSVSIPCNFNGHQNDNVSGNHGYAGMYITNPRVNAYQSTYSETIKTQLATPLSANTAYQLSFDVSLAEGQSQKAIKFQALLMDAEVGLLTGGIIPTSQFTPNYILLQNPTFSTASSAATANGWERITFTFTTGSVAGQKYLYLGGINNVQFQVQTALSNPCPNPASTAPENSYYYIDNVNLQPIPSGVPTLSLPALMCSPGGITNLAGYLSAAQPGGYFTGNGVTFSGGMYSFSPVAAGMGNHAIVYNYSYQGCPVTVTDYIRVDLQSGSIGGSTTACETSGSNSTTNSFTIPAGYTALWSIIQGEGTIVGANNQSSVNINWTDLPGYINLQLTSPSGCVFNFEKVIIDQCACNCLSTIAYNQTVSGNTSSFTAYNTNPNCSGTANVKYVWDFGDGSSFSSFSSSTSHTYATSATYTVTVTTRIIGIHDESLCNNTKTFTTYPGSGGSTRDRHMQVGGDETQNFDEIVKIHPNPASTEINVDVEMLTDGPLLVRMTGMDGKLLAERKTELQKGKQSLKIELPNSLPDGIIFVEVSGQRTKVVKKLMIKK